MYLNATAEEAYQLEANACLLFGYIHLLRVSTCSCSWSVGAPGSFESLGCYADDRPVLYEKPIPQMTPYVSENKPCMY